VVSQSAGNSKKTAKPRGKPFAPGQSGNPNGRPKTTPEQKDALQAIRDLAPKAAQELEKILDAEDGSYAVKLKAIDMILERTYGKAEATVNLNDPQRDDLSDLKQRVAEFKAGGKGDK
jgi:hypothetical protein